MQLFGLINSLFITSNKLPKINNSEYYNFSNNLLIKRYSVIPLSSNVGLIGWVDNCDTLNNLIKEYRENKKIVIDLEYKKMLSMVPENKNLNKKFFDNLSLIQKIEVFQYGLGF
jgi:serine/threonine-protein kinase mTOR